MKKVAFSVAAIVVMMLVGCSDGSSSSGAVNTPSANDTTANASDTNTVEGVRGLTQFPAVPAIPE
jgi:outer membrane lipoprotein SlyB